MLFLLRPPRKQCHCDVTMPALYFLSREKVKTRRRECPTCNEKRGEGKGEMDHHSSDEKWTRKPVFILSSNKQLELRTQTFISVPLYPVSHTISLFVKKHKHTTFAVMSAC